MSRTLKSLRFNSAYELTTEPATAWQKTQDCWVRDKGLLLLTAQQAAWASCSPHFLFPRVHGSDGKQATWMLQTQPRNPQLREPQSFMRGLLANLSKLCLEREIILLYFSGNRSTLGPGSNRSTLRLLCLFLSPLLYKHPWKHVLEQKLLQDVQKHNKPISCRKEVSKTCLLRLQLIPLLLMWNTDSYFWRKANVKTSSLAQMLRQTINTSIKFCPKSTIWDNILSWYLTSLQLKCQLK